MQNASSCTPQKINDEINLLNLLAKGLEKNLNQPVTCISRLAGQYAKPRSAITQSKNGKTLLCYRGDSINQPEFTIEARMPNPQRLLHAYDFSSQTLKFIGEQFTSHEALLLYYEEALTHQVGENWFNLSTHFPWLGMRTGQLDGAPWNICAELLIPSVLKLDLTRQRNGLSICCRF